jgi:hypothetical protein
VIASFGLLASTLAAAQPVASGEPQVPEQVDEIVVTARRQRPPPLLDALGYFRKHCYEALRGGQPGQSLEEDSDWTPLDERARGQFGITDLSVPAFGLSDPERGQQLAIKLERFRREAGVVETRCTLAVIGGMDHYRLRGGLSRLLRGAPTERHVGHEAGTAKLEGWKQWLWTAMPGRRSRAWHLPRSGRASARRDTWIVVIDPAFYDGYDYVLGDLKVRQGGRTPLSMLSLAHLTRPR